MVRGGGAAARPCVLWASRQSPSRPSHCTLRAVQPPYGPSNTPACFLVPHSTACLSHCALHAQPPYGLSDKPTDFEPAWWARLMRATHPRTHTLHTVFAAALRPL